MNKISFYFVFLTIFILLSCEKVVDNVELPEVEPVLVSQTFIKTSGDSVKVYLSKSVPVFYTFQEGFEDVTDALVTISDGFNTDTLTFIASFDGWNPGYYLSVGGKLNCNANSGLSLKVIAKDGDSIFSNCVLPDLPDYQINFIKKDSVADEWSYSGYYYTTELEFVANNSSSVNYYHLSGFGYGIYPGSTISEAQLLDDYDIDYGLFKLGKGEKVKLIYTTSLPLDSALFYVLRTDEHYYNYHRSAKTYQGDNPFAEPVIIYSNIENGLGVFCGYNQVVKRIKF